MYNEQVSFAYAEEEEEGNRPCRINDLHTPYIFQGFGVHLMLMGNMEETSNMREHKSRTTWVAWIINFKFDMFCVRSFLYLVRRAHTDNCMCSF